MRKNMKEEKGITVISVIITVIVLLILASVATVSGISTVRFSRYMAFKTELQILQNEVNSLRQNKSEEELQTYGVAMDTTQKNIFSISVISSILEKKTDDMTVLEDGFRFFSKDYLTNDLGIDGITRDYYINLKDRIIIATEPVAYNDVNYYMLEQMDDGAYNVVYNAQTGEMTFRLETEQTSADTGTIKILDINYTGYIDKWKAEYRLSGEETWHNAGEFTGDTYEFEVSQTGTYEVRLVHGDEFVSDSLTIALSDKKTIYEVEDEIREVANNGYTAKIPAGFAVVPGCEDITGGLVISDVSNDTNNQGNQYVWIPVDGILGEEGKTLQNAVNGEIILGRYVFKEDGTIDTTPDVTPTILGGQLKESSILSIYYTEEITGENAINSFIKSVRENSGYYISRYEAGVENGKLDLSDMISSNTAPNSDWTGYRGENVKIVSKKGAQVWNYVTRDKARALCQNLYPKVNSDLVNSYAWDTAILFIQKYADNDYSRQNGYSTIPNQLANTGEGKLADINDFDNPCNIYDMAGNCIEWTTEISSNASYPCVSRGGNYSDQNLYMSNRDTISTTYAIIHFSFRPLLYL